MSLCKTADVPEKKIRFCFLRLYLDTTTVVTFEVPGLLGIKNIFLM